ncbi:MAG: LacI family DNA-binding transcriptional regulator [Rubricoccaceae bacterium]|nr:LacI family DNA-binding transcriptional regulator [Rubricoccaceae bacterium]
MSATIRQVAREAGVSIATVSRVLNGSGPTALETRKLVRRAAERLRYVPNAAAQNLVRSRTDTIGVVLPFFAGEFYPEVVRGLDLAVQEAGWNLLLSTSHNAPADTERALCAMHGRVDGLVVMTPALPLARLAALAQDLPLVLLNAPTAGHAFDVLSTDGYGGARLAVAHLIALGHERIAVLAGEAGNHDADARLAGWRDELQAHSLPIPEAFVLRGDFSRESGVISGRRLAELAARADGPTAAFVSSDYMAMGAIWALVEAGLSVPGDVALASFDDIPSAAYFNPSLTTVHAHTQELSARAAALLLARISSGTDGGPHRDVLPVRLEVRASSGVPR